MTDGPLFAGLSEIQPPDSVFEFGEGVSLRPAEAHLMRPFLMTYRRPESSFPGMMTATGSFGFDLVAELHLPESFHLDKWFDRPNTAWWLAALIRLKATSRLRVPVLSNASFSELSKTAGQRFWPVEFEAERTRLILDPEAGDAVSRQDLVWVQTHWLRGGHLMREKREFNVLFQAFDQSPHSRDPVLALLLMWSALEAMFSPGQTELRFRVATNIATFLEPPGESRMVLQKVCAKLYDARSAAAHGRPEVADEPLISTYSLIRRILQRILEVNHVPTVAELEQSLFHGR